MLLQHLFDHDAWANLTLIEFCRQLDADQLAAAVTGTRGRLDDTLVHILAAEQRYLRTLGAGEAERPLREGERPDLDSLAQIGNENGQRWQRLLEATDEAWLNGVFETEYQGQKVMMQRPVVIAQALHHGHDHRSHCSVIITQLGLEPPVLDSWHHGQARFG